VYSETLDHTSLLKYVQEKWELRRLTARVDASNSFSSVIERTARVDTPERIEVASEYSAMELAAVDEGKSDNQKALHAFCQYLEQYEMAPSVAEGVKMAMAAQPLSEEEQDRQRFEVFLHEQQSKAARRRRK
jgi:hypothetical protein